MTGESLPEVNILWEQWGDPSLPADRTILIMPSFSHGSHVASNLDDPSPGRHKYIRSSCTSFNVYQIKVGGRVW